MLVLAILVSGLVYLWAVTAGVRPLVYVLKPGTMALIIALAWGRVGASVYDRAVLVGLLFSVVGDVAPPRRS